MITGEGDTVGQQSQKKIVGQKDKQYGGVG
jgi:hypothetical protein